MNNSRYLDSVKLSHYGGEIGWYYYHYCYAYQPTSFSLASQSLRESGILYIGGGGLVVVRLFSEYGDCC